MELTQLLDRLDGVRHLPSGYSARCPGHDDRIASLSVNHGRDGGIVIKCQAGCPTEHVMGALNLSMGELAATPHVTATYNYTDEWGRVLYQVQRWVPKDFRCVPGLPEPAHRVLYNLPAIQWAKANHVPLYIVEGEKTVDRLAAMEIPATTNVGGAGTGKWFPHYTQTLAGLDLIIVADNDDPGREHARHIAAQCRTLPDTTVTLMHSRHGKDIDDGLDAGYGLDATLEPLPDYDEIGAYTASEIPTRRIEWLWPGYFPRGAISLVSGDPSAGKSLFTLDLAARLSTGAKMPDGSLGAEPGWVILVSAEDDESTTIKPRLVAAGADLSRIKLVLHGSGGPDVPFDFLTGLPALRVLADQLSPVAIVFDPLMAFVGERVDTNNDAQVRRALRPLFSLARNTHAAVVVVRHLNKATGIKAMYRGGGSIGFTGAVRAEYMVIVSPDSPQDRLFCCIKNNLAPLPPTLGYRVDTSPADYPVITWTGAVDLTAQLALDRGEGFGQGSDDFVVQRTARRLEREFLGDLLGDGEARTWAEIVRAGKEQGFTDSKLVRARADLGLVKIYGDRGNADVRWGLPRPVSTVSAPVLQADTTEPDEIDRDAELAERPLVCEICETTDKVMRYGRPHWVVRCRPHDPRRYGVAG